MSLSAGTVIGHYRIERPIGTGGFSTVYKASDDRLDSTVAIKVLAENRSLDVDARRRFVAEAQKLRLVRSASIINVFDVGETVNGQPYMVLDYADRGDLASRIVSVGRSAQPGECLVVASFLRSALAALHQGGLVHRDVKPHNILIRSEPGPAEPAGPNLVGSAERLLLSDLGFVKDLNHGSGMTVGGGTWAYQAPEQLRRMGTVDRRADIYAATAVVAALVLHRLPDEQRGWLDLLGSAPIEPRLRTAFGRGLADRPEDRHCDVEDWYADFGGAFGNRPAPSAAPPAPPPPPPPAAIAPPVPRQGAVQVTTPMPVTTPTPAGTPAAERRPRSRGRVRLLVAGLALALAGFAAGALPGRDDDGADTRISGSSAITSARVADRDVTITGPAEVEVGIPATFVATLDRGLSAHWVLPDGATLPAGEGVVYTADSAGEFTVTLLVVAPGSPPRIVAHSARARP